MHKLPMPSKCLRLIVKILDDCSHAYIHTCIYILLYLYESFAIQCHAGFVSSTAAQLLFPASQASDIGATPVALGYALPFQV